MNNSVKAILEAITVAGVILAIALMPLLVNAESGCQHQGMNMPTFADIDTNDDGCISPEEFAAHQAARHTQK